MGVKIAIYSRKSKFTGKGESTHNQIETCKRKIELTFDNVDLENDIIIYEDDSLETCIHNKSDAVRNTRLLMFLTT